MSHSETVSNKKKIIYQYSYLLCTRGVCLLHVKAGFVGFFIRHTSCKLYEEKMLFRRVLISLYFCPPPPPPYRTTTSLVKLRI